MKHFRHRGFTLVEVMVVVAIMAILAGIIMAVMPSARKAAIKSNCMSNMNQTVIAINLYCVDYDDHYPRDLSRLPKSTPYYCPMEPVRYMYFGQFAVYDHATKQSVFATGFDPAIHAILKCNQHNDWQGRFSIETSRRPDGTEFQYKVPTSDDVMPKYHVLGAFLDGHVKMVPDEDDWVTQALQGGGS